MKRGKLKEFRELVKEENRKEFERIRSQYPNEQYNGVYFNYNLVRDGGMFYFFREAHHTDQDIKEAERLLRRDRDVVSLTILKV